MARAERDVTGEVLGSQSGLYAYRKIYRIGLERGKPRASGFMQYSCAVASIFVGQEKRCKGRLTGDQTG